MITSLIHSLFCRSMSPKYGIKVKIGFVSPTKQLILNPVKKISLHKLCSSVTLAFFF